MKTTEKMAVEIRQTAEPNRVRRACNMTSAKPDDERPSAQPVTSQPGDWRERAWSKTAWLDLETPCEGEPVTLYRDEQARADIDWLDLRRAVGGTALAGETPAAL